MMIMLFIRLLLWLRVVTTALFLPVNKNKNNGQKMSKQNTSVKQTDKTKKKRLPQLPPPNCPQKITHNTTRTPGPAFFWRFFFPRLRDVKCIQASSRAFAAIKADGSASWTSFCWLGFCRINILNLII